MKIVSVSDGVINTLTIFIKEVLRSSDKSVERYSEEHIRYTLDLVDKVIIFLQSKKTELKGMLDYIYERNKDKGQ